MEAINRKNIGVQIPEWRTQSSGNKVNKWTQTEESPRSTIDNTLNEKQSLKSSIFSEIQFEFCISNIYITKYGLARLHQEHFKRPLIMLQCEFMGQPIQTALNPVNGENLILEQDYWFTVDNANYFYDCVTSATPVFLWILDGSDIDDSFKQIIGDKMSGSVDNQKSLLATGRIEFEDILKYPHNRIYSNGTMWIKSDQERSSIESTGDRDMLFGSLLFWYKLHGEFEDLDNFISQTLNKRAYIPEMSPKHRSREGSILSDCKKVGWRRSTVVLINSQNNEPKPPSVDITTPDQIRSLEGSVASSTCSTNDDSTQQQQEEQSVNLTTVRKIQGCKIQSKSLDQRIDWLFEEANWKRTLQEYAVLNGLNISDLESKEWRNKMNLVIGPRKYILSKNTPRIFTIVVHSLKLFPHSIVMNDSRINRLFIEYRFLDYDGPELETPISLSKFITNNGFLVFEFEKQFNFEGSSHVTDCKVLSEKVLHKETLTFLLVSEPDSGSFDSTADCEEIGFTQVKYYDLVDAEVDIKRFDYPVQSMVESDVQIGLLTLSFLGVNVLRQVALDYLTPAGFKYAVSF